ncbi:MAG: DUF349 domain-containing protein [Actinomycetaceae bacterium]|nr:DUF349 domain-containing protein [Actinomycetaceae bacterium]
MSESTERPTPKPGPRPIPKPRPAQSVQPPVPSLSDTAAAEAAAWGRVDDEGNVWLRSNDGERIVGQYAAEGSPKDALAIYVRRYLDLKAQLSLIEARIETISPEESASALKAFEKQLVEPAAVGDIDALRARAEEIASKIEERKAEHQARRAQAKEAALSERQAIVARAEEIAASVESPINWRDTRAELMDLLEKWRTLQKRGPRIDKATSDALWKRLSHSRKVFEEARRAYFVKLDAHRSEVTAAKERLIARAEEIAHSTDWRETSNEMRRLMDEWKAAGRASRRDDDRLWERFMAAREVFFQARAAHHAAVDQEFADNLKAKLELVEQAEALLPIADIKAAKATMRDIGEQWEAIGMVSRADYQRIESRMRHVEDEIRRAEDEQWRRSDPQKKQRSSGMAAQLEALIAELDSEIAQAEEAGDSKKLAELHEARRAREAWLAQVNKDL